MSLGELFKDAAVIITEAFDDVPRRINFQYPSHSQSFNEESNQLVNDPGEIVPDIPMFFMKFSRQEIDGDKILTTDIKALVASRYLPNGVEAGGTVTCISTAKKYDAEQLSADAASATYTLRLRGA